MMYWLDTPVKEKKMKTNDPYNEIVEIVRASKRMMPGDFVAWVYTPLGFEVVFCEYNGSEDRYEWVTDWYEGGDCYLLYFAEFSDVEPTISQKWEGYIEPRRE